MEQIEIKILSDLIYVRVPVWSGIERQYLMARMLIDTGASVTAFADSALKRLVCYSENRKTSVRTAGGNVDVCEVKLPKIKLGNTELNNIDVHAHAHLDDFHFDGIIGMNILSLFNVCIDFDEKLLTLKNRCLQ
jgi:predicted aspartyl protease